MSKIIVNPKDESLRDIFGNGKKYLVPKFQRDYSWENEHWRDLWEDIELINSEEEEHHYMGYLVLEETGERLYKVIDGQQRLTTFSLLILAAIKRLKKINEEKRADSLFKNFIGSENLTYLTVDKKFSTKPLIFSPSLIAANFSLKKSIDSLIKRTVSFTFRLGISFPSTASR